MLLAISLGLLCVCTSSFHLVTAAEDDSRAVPFKLQILAVGDSLTAGFMFKEGKYEFHPYTRKITELCGVCRTQNIGVTGMMARVMKEHMIRGFEVGTDVVIILGGTNDLIRHIPGTTIANDVIEMHEAAKQLMLDNGITRPVTIAITIPDTHGKAHDEQRRIANQLIKRYVSAHAERTLLFDMEDIWPILSSPENAEMWSPDLMHFSIRGYDRMGYELYEIMKLHYLLSPR